MPVNSSALRKMRSRGRCLNALKSSVQRIRLDIRNQNQKSDRLFSANPAGVAIHFG